MAGFQKLTYRGAFRNAGKCSRSIPAIPNKQITVTKNKYMATEKPKSPGKKSAPAKKKPDLKMQKVQARWTFPSEERAELGLTAGREHDEIGNLESQLASIKKDYASKIEAAENRRNQAFAKMKDGFEMREIEAIVIFNAPAKGRKSIFRYDSTKKGGKGEFVIEEPMTPGDFQQELFDAEKPGTAKGETPEFSDELIKSATEAVRKNGKASIAFLQRTFTLGYSACTRLMDKLESLGVVGPSKGSEPREIKTPPLNPVLSEDVAEKISNPPANDVEPVTKTAAQIREDLRNEMPED